MIPERVLCAGWLSFPDVCVYVGIGKTEMRDLVRRNDFPIPSSPTGSAKGRRWSKIEIDDYMKANRLEPISN